MKKIMVLILSAALICLCGCSVNDEISASSGEISTSEPSENTGTNKNVSEIIVSLGGKEFEAVIFDCSCAEEFLSRLPLTLNMNELNGNEKYYKFSDSFSAEPEYSETIFAGDIMLYQRDCLVLFYETHNTSYSYTRMGYIKDAEGLKEAAGDGNITVTFEISHK